LKATCIVGRHASWKVTNGAENLILQTLQFLNIGVCRKLPGGLDISQHWPREHFVEG